MTEPEIVVVADPEAGAIEAAARIAQGLIDAVKRRGRADWATTGGSTPIGIYRRLVAPPLVDAIPWAAVHVWWGDDRFVPPDHPLSNVKPFEDIVLGESAREEGTAGTGSPEGIVIPPENLHPFRTGEAIAESHDAAWCAEALARELRSVGMPSVDGWPAFDVMLLGVGGDGHILSVFPGSAALDSKELALGIPAPTHIEPKVPRVTLNPAVVGVARDLLMVVYGADKADILGAIFGAERDPHHWPAQLARRAGATWILDEAAAAGVKDLPR
jgi:6-phosphogluconolactonase